VANNSKILIETKRFKQPLSHKILFKVVGRNKLKKFPLWFLKWFSLTYILYIIEKAEVIGLGFVGE
jgi:hypothetical protein